MANVGCSCAKRTDEYHGWECEITGGACAFYIPSSKSCAEMFGEGPDAEHNRCEDCEDFYLEEGKRCCKNERYSFIDGDFVKTKYIEDSVVCCGGFKYKNTETTEKVG